MATTPVFLRGESHGQRNLEGYSAQGRKEADMTEHLTQSLLSSALLLSRIPSLSLSLSHTHTVTLTSSPQDTGPSSCRKATHSSGWFWEGAGCQDSAPGPSRNFRSLSGSYLETCRLLFNGPAPYLKLLSKRAPICIQPRAPTNSHLPALINLK